MVVNVMDVVQGSGEYPAKAIVEVFKRVRGSDVLYPTCATVELSPQAAAVIKSPGRYNVSLVLEESVGARAGQTGAYATSSVVVRLIADAQPVKA